jgi:hypothetical protein
MRCMACHGIMHLVETIPAKVIRAPGYEHRSFRCSTCSAIERRLAYTIQDLPQPAEPPPVSAAAMKLQARPSQEVLAELAAWARMMGKLRDRQQKRS